MTRKPVFKTLLILIFFAPPLCAQNVEAQLKKVAYNVEFAVLPIRDNGLENLPPNHPPVMQVVGTAFLVTPDGYFVTAAHVLQDYKPKTAQVTVGLRQRSGDGGGLWFDLIEKDEAHDLALCKTTIPLPEFKQHKDNPGTETPIASLRITTAEPITGGFIAIAGFPLGSSGDPTIQFGTVAATRTTNPNAGGVPAGQRELLQISVPGNGGNSGSPVLDLDTGDVIGVIVQVEAAPLLSTISGKQLLDIGLAQSSGVMLAVPASWVQDLLKRHNVQSVAQPPPQGHTSYVPVASK